MLEEVGKALGVWPLLQVSFFGLSFAAGIYGIVLGVRGKSGDEKNMEQRRLEWAAYEQLENIEQNTFRMVEQQKATLEAIKSLSGVMWNQGRGRLGGPSL